METKAIYNEEDEAVKTTLLHQYSGRCHWLKDQRFLRELEGDSVDTEILDEELRSIQDQEPKTCRGKTLKVLDSNPFQIVLCVLVLVDAGVVIAEILLDLHAIRSQLVETEHTMALGSQYLRASYSQDLYGYNLESLDDVLYVLGSKYGDNMTEVRAKVKCDSIPSSTSIQKHQSMNRFRRNTQKLRLHTGISKTGNSAHGKNTGNVSNVNNEASPQSASSNNSPIVSNNMKLAAASSSNDMTSANDITAESRATEDVYPSREFYRSKSLSLTNSNSTGTHKYHKKKKGKYTYAEKLLKIAHILHYCSIGILGLFVFQVIVKMYGMGLEFFRQKLEVFDAVIISASFALDLVFLNGIGGAQGEEAAALLIVFLLWRLLRVINGLMVTEKKRQEFRLKLQKRARRKCEKRVEVLEEEKRLKEKEIEAIRELCKHKGASDIEISKCRPRKVKSLFNKMDTSAGLSSIAALSLGFGMSMSSSRIVHSPALTRPTQNKAPNKATQPKTPSGEIQLHNIMVGVGLYNETTTTPAKTPKKFLSVPKYRKRRSPNSSPRGEKKLSINMSCSQTKSKSPTFSRSCKNSPEMVSGDGGTDSSVDDVVFSDQNGNIGEDNRNQNNSHMQSSEGVDAKSDFHNESDERSPLFTAENSEASITPQCKNTIHISSSPSVNDSRQSQSSTILADDVNHKINDSYGINSTKTEPVNESEGGNAPNGESIRPQNTPHTSKDISKQNEPCRAKRAIFATKSHPYVIKSSLSASKQKPGSLDSSEARNTLDGNMLKDCLINGRVNSEHSNRGRTIAVTSMEKPTLHMVCEDGSL